MSVLIHVKTNSLQQFSYYRFFFRTQNYPSLESNYGILILNKYVTIHKHLVIFIIEFYDMDKFIEKKHLQNFYNMCRIFFSL